ncbi:MAG: class III poly(R)-hydroxyalkanoic acid synthase subunit PhaC [Cycloclasticus sp. symbiont of Bathymodiolus heckerae]|nr:MAG: class III poly(R)-hydroxyalkanoic acid synthase subunit PhaC [Cycloclasticus sp. symbiont of Bathymodiolus heckerae]
MASSNTQFDDVWQDDFILLMDHFDGANESSSPKVGATAKELVYNENKLRLFRYCPLDVKQKKTPILITYALVNRPFIVDLEPKRSLVLRLLEHGYPVYIIDWGYPDSSDCFTSLDDYINGYLYRCVQQVKKDSKRKKIDLLGICQGGVFSLCYSALHPADIRKLVTLVTPVDFHAEGNTLNLWTNGINTNIFNNQSGNISSQLISQLFKALKPFQLSRDKYRQLKNIVSKKENFDTFLRMENWLNNSPDLAGLAAKEFLINFYQKNRLHNRTLKINHRPVLLEKINAPLLNLYATQDHIVPPNSARALGQHIKPALYQEQPLNGGHIGAFTSLKTQQLLISSLVNWLG